jgi:hypothetical protein
MFRNGTWRGFLAGVLCGALLIGVGVGAFVWWKSYDARSAEDEVTYDACLMKRGNTVACDALMRELDRERTAETAIKKEAAKMLASGVSKLDVVLWARGRGVFESQLSDALGISQKELLDLLANNTDRPWCDFRPESQRAECMVEPNQK